MNEVKGSPAWSLAAHDVWKITKGGLIAAVGVLATYIAANVGAIDSSTTAGAILAGVVSIVANAVVKYTTNTQTPVK